MCYKAGNFYLLVTRYGCGTGPRNNYFNFAVTPIMETQQNSLIQRASRRFSSCHPSAEAMGVSVGVSFGP
jgi:hypothetical protein